jgi:hypothetical protein
MGHFRSHNGPSHVVPSHVVPSSRLWTSNARTASNRPDTSNRLSSRPSWSLTTTADVRGSDPTQTWIGNPGVEIVNRAGRDDGHAVYALCALIKIFEDEHERILRPWRHPPTAAFIASDRLVTVLHSQEQRGKDYVCTRTVRASAQKQLGGVLGQNLDLGPLDGLGSGRLVVQEVGAGT